MLTGMLYTGSRDGASITMQALCNVQVPPNFCQEGGSAITFTSDVEGRSLRGLVSFYPLFLDDPIRDADFESGIDRAADILHREGLYTAADACMSQQSDAGAHILDLTAAAQCLHQWSIGVLQTTRTPLQLPHIPRSVLVASGNFGRSLPYGMHASLLVWTTWFQPHDHLHVAMNLLVNIQP